MTSLNLIEKRDGKIKARKLIGGNKLCNYITKEDASSSTVVSAEGTSKRLTCVIDVREERAVTVVNIPNKFVQTVVKDKEHQMIIHIRRPLVFGGHPGQHSTTPHVYGPYVWFNKSWQKVLLVQCLNALYELMVTALLHYKKFVKSLKKQGFKLNPYDGCVANKTVKGKQITICFHVNDCNKISHESIKKVVDSTIDWLRAEYEGIFEDGLGAMKVHRGKIHKYLGMSLNFSEKGQ